MLFVKYFQGILINKIDLLVMKIPLLKQFPDINERGLTILQCCMSIDMFMFMSFTDV